MIVVVVIICDLSALLHLLQLSLCSLEMFVEMFFILPCPFFYGLKMLSKVPVSSVPDAKLDW